MDGKLIFCWRLAGVLVGELRISDIGGYIEEH